jgi:hypothetical protein
MTYKEIRLQAGRPNYISEAQKQPDFGIKGCRQRESSPAYALFRLHKTNFTYKKTEWFVDAWKKK